MLWEQTWRSYSCAVWFNVFCAVSLKSAALSTGFFFLFAAIAGAQDFRAKLTVTVMDPAGMAIPSAGLELRSSSTSEVSSAKANDVGVYSFLFLQPGTYSLNVSAAGFKPAARENIALQSYQASGIDVKLEVGGGHRQRHRYGGGRPSTDRDSQQGDERGQPVGNRPASGQP